MFKQYVHVCVFVCMCVTRVLCVCMYVCDRIGVNARVYMLVKIELHAGQKTLMKAGYSPILPAIKTILWD